MTLDPTEAATARHRLYALLGRLLVEGPRGDVWGSAARVPALAALAPDPDDAAALDELSAQHYAVMTEVPCVASAVLDPAGLVGGAITEGVVTAYREGGFHPGRTDVGPDHVGIQLAFLAHLSAAEAEARHDGVTEAIPRLEGLQQRFLDTHLLAWLPAWVTAVGALQAPLWQTAAELSLELAAAHRGTLPGTSRPPALSGEGIDLDDPASDLRGIAAMLARSARSGWLIGRAPLDRACSRAGVSSRIGGREAALAAALSGAAALGCLDALVDGLLEELDRWDTALVRVEGALTVPVSAWRDRVVVTRHTLTVVRDATGGSS